MLKINQILVGTHNSGKFKEISNLLPRKIKKISPTALKIASPRETGKTFLQNSILKAKYFYKKDALGKGDSKLISMIALWLGGFGMVFSISITYIFAAFCLLIAINLKLIKRNQLIPFAPFLSLGGLTVWFFGNQTLIKNFIQ